MLARAGTNRVHLQKEALIETVINGMEGSEIKGMFCGLALQPLTDALIHHVKLNLYVVLRIINRHD